MHAPHAGMAARPGRLLLTDKTATTRGQRYRMEDSLHGFHGAAFNHLHFLYQPGPARFAAGQRMASDEHGALCPAVGSGPRADADFLLHDCVKPEQRAAHPPVWHGQAHGRFRDDDGAGASGLFPCPALRMAAHHGDPAGAGRGRGGCGAQQLCRPALPGPAHELAALLLGSGHHRRADGPLRLPFNGMGMAGRIPHNRPDAVRRLRSALCHAEPLEAGTDAR